MSLKERYDTGDSFFEGLDYIDEENNSSESNEFKDYDWFYHFILIYE